MYKAIDMSYPQIGTRNDERITNVGILHGVNSIRKS